MVFRIAMQVVLFGVAILCLAGVLAEERTENKAVFGGMTIAAFYLMMVAPRLMR